MKLKTTIVTGVCLLLGVTLRADLPANITTTDGQTYTGISLIRTEPDGYLVNYEPVKNGIGIAKIKFSRLSSDQQKEAGYDAAKASAFEAKAAQGTENWRQENLRLEESAKAQRQAQQSMEGQEEQLDIARITAMAQLKQAEADLARATGEGGGGYGWSLGGGAIAIPEVGVPHRDAHPRAKIFEQPRPLTLRTPPFVGAGPQAGRR